MLQRASLCNVSISLEPHKVELLEQSMCIIHFNTYCPIDFSNGYANSTSISKCKITHVWKMLLWKLLAFLGCS